jgi:hypothetical protein
MNPAEDAKFVANKGYGAREITDSIKINTELHCSKDEAELLICWIDVPCWKYLLNYFATNKAVNCYAS